MHCLPFALLCSALAAQQPAPPPTIPDDLAALAARVGAAHCANGPVPRIEAIRGLLTIQLLDRTAEQRGQIDLDVRFLDWRPATGTKTVPLIRYEVLDAGEAIVRGQDRDGPWQLVRGEPRDLSGADFVQDLAACERHTNLARQLLLYLSPADVLRSLQRPSPVRPTLLPLRRGKELPCLTVLGDLPAFPLLQQGGADGPVRVQVFVDAETGRLAGLDAFPRDGDIVDEARGERILLADLRARDGVLVPHEIRHLFREAGQLVLKSSVQILQLSLRPELRAEDFDRQIAVRRR